MFNIREREYFNKLKKSKFPPGYNGIISMIQSGEEIVLPGFVNCPAVVGLSQGYIWLLHHHFESRLKEEVVFPENIFFESLFIFGTNLERIFNAQGKLMEQFPHSSSKPIIKQLKKFDLVSELSISRDDNLVNLSFYNPFNLEQLIFKIFKF